MRASHAICLIAIAMLLAGCYQGISGTVIDAETGQPVEGAVVLVEWTKTKGFGLTYTVSYKVAEKLTGQDGKFILPGCFNPFVNAPDVTIYKKGFVTWSSRWIYPSRQNRTNYTWGNDQVYTLNRFSEEYSYNDHTDFIRASINSSMNLESKKMTYDAFRWEDHAASQELDRSRRK